jgi:hypothetical protein
VQNGVCEETPRNATIIGHFYQQYSKSRSKKIRRLEQGTKAWQADRSKGISLEAWQSHGA